ncbi:MAG TPA: amylo-alpha-1,6-glucosidase [Hyphomicrobiales bacterium]|nr:amylo-alpha-1,6-glucosidase [Hyphomicrobiales bacterium]
MPLPPQSGPDRPEPASAEPLSLVERAVRTLKHGDAFAVLDSHGDAGIVPGTPEGLFFRDTRYLSRFELLIQGKRPQLLSSVLQDDNAALVVDLTNGEVDPENRFGLPSNVIALDRTKFIWNDACFERIAFHNFDTRARSFHLGIRFDADFRDLFEVRGTPRARRGRRSQRVVGPDAVEFVYGGLDGTTRTTRLTFSPAPARLALGEAEFVVALEPGGRGAIFVTADFSDGQRTSRPNFLTAYREKRRDMRAKTAGIATVASSNDLFNEVCVRATTDLYTLMTRTPYGLYPYAGIPWFSTVFGRDGLITAMLLLWVDPTIARGVLDFLAATQATERDEAADAEPGKILHERRLGEMAALGEVPFRRYYGTIDATPLFVMLAGMYLQRTGDKAAIAALWPHVEAALRWCDEFGDRDGDGFVEYFRENANGLVNQGWKDSHDSIFHADGSDARGPIALVEVQAYVFAAKRHAAHLAEVLGHHRRADVLRAEAEVLRRRFEDAFWCEDLGIYALALDGAKRPCRVRTSNAGHALFAGIAAPARARRVAEALMGQEAFSGWGIRTLASDEARFNPMSYHNGSVWPHDNALIALGFARYGFKDKATAVFEAMFEAATYQESRRLPELFCGFLRHRRRGPTAYPVACSPQAWAAATPFAFLAASAGLDIDHAANEIRFIQPELPDFLDEVTLRGIRLGGAQITLQMRRHGADVTMALLHREGDVNLVMSK